MGRTIQSNINYSVGVDIIKDGHRVNKVKIFLNLENKVWGKAAWIRPTNRERQVVINDSSKLYGQNINRCLANSVEKTFMSFFISLNTIAAMSHIKGHSYIHLQSLSNCDN